MKIKNCGVYWIKNIKNKKVYVGSSKNISKRWKEHKKDLDKGTHQNIHLQNAWNLYGKKYFLFSVIEYCSGDKLLQKEQYWIDTLDVINKDKGYNISLKASSPMKGRKHSLETLKLFSQMRKGQKFTDEHKANISKSNKGKKRSPEVIAKLKQKKGHTEAQREALKRRNDTYHGGNNPNAKKVICLESLIIYNTISDVPDSHLSSLSRACKSHLPYKGNHYLFLKDYRSMTDTQRNEVLRRKSNLGKKVMCIEDNLVFDKLKDAASFYSVYPGDIRRSCKLLIPIKALSKNFKYLTKDEK